MKRLNTQAQADFCDSCGAAVLTAGYDVLGEVAATIIADPIVLTKQQQIACVIGRRRTFRVEARTYDVHLGINHPGTAERWMLPPDDVVVEHRCGRVFSGTATTAFTQLLAVHAAYVSDEVPW